ncbi:hypothetical protein [Corynebacterium glyciniphilum]|uniref:hypothetical protein n=1 Tax=Corynebacterium glyciniphilum TaxID=1404244 RepID=UPI002356AD36
MIGTLTLVGCGTSEHSEQESFSFTGSELWVSHGNKNQPVNVVESTESEGEVTVGVSSRTLGQKPETPAWSLSDDVLTLDTPCGGSVIGYCEANWSITVPDGVEVMVDGQRTAP